MQAVAGQMLGFFAEIGCQFPQFPFIAHSRGWSAEDMENNQRYVQKSELLHEGAAALVRRCAEMAQVMIESTLGADALIVPLGEGRNPRLQAKPSGGASRSPPPREPRGFPGTA